MDEGRFRARFGRFNTLIFVHVPKAAGTTLREVLERQFRHSTIYLAYNPRERIPGQRGIDSLTTEQRGEIGLVEGHIEFGWHALFPQKAVYLTMLRDPVDRVLSQYYYIREDVRHTLHDTVVKNRMGIEEYLKGRVNPRAINGQTYFISGGFDPGGPQSEGEDALRRAKKNIDAFFPAIGIQERFDESLVLFKRVYQWRWVYYYRKNVTSSRPSLKSVPEGVVRTIREVNQLDSELYEHALRRFDEQVRVEGQGFAGELARFRRDNATYGKMLSPLLNSDPRGMMRVAESEVRGMISAFAGQKPRGR